MSRPTSNDRDRLDELIAKAAQAARRPVDVPAPSASEPSDDELLRVVEGSASREERERVDEAAARSAFTRDRLDILKEALADSGHTGPVERAARYVFVVAKETIDFLRGATEPVAAPAWSHAVRGAAPSVDDTIPDAFFELLHPLSDDVDARIRVEHVTRGGMSLDLQVQLLGKNGAQVAGARVTLARGSQTVESTPVDDHGKVTFTSLDAARYRVEVRRAGATIGTVILDFVNEE